MTCLPTGHVESAQLKITVLVQAASQGHKPSTARNRNSASAANKPTDRPHSAHQGLLQSAHVIVSIGLLQFGKLNTHHLSCHWTSRMRVDQGPLYKVI